MIEKFVVIGNPMLAMPIFFAAAVAYAADVPCDIQIFGDTFVNSAMLSQGTGDTPYLDGVRNLLNTCSHNVINLEGVITPITTPLTSKRHLLRMPIGTAQSLRLGGIDAATLANNHSMDFGYLGLSDSLKDLSAAGIEFTGAGTTIKEAIKPLIIGTSGAPVCILAFSRTLPEVFWASSTRPGTAFGSNGLVAATIRACQASNLFTIASFHWGRESSHEVLPYQRSLARLAIEAGAGLVVGHHPHTVQKMELYRGKPIFYSIGNFAFGTQPIGGKPEGVSVRLGFEKDARLRLTIVPLQVNNAVIHFRPRPLVASELSRQYPLDPPPKECPWDRDAERWSCLLGE